MKRQWKRTLSVLLSVAMLFSMTGMNTVFATEGGQTVGASNLCEHHPAHTADCGYTGGMPEVPCAHEHTDECYREVTDCTHTHTDECYGDEIPTATDSGAAEPVNCAHGCDEESGCVTEELDCQHAHDETCGYVPAVDGTPCVFVCGECAKDSGQPSPESAPCALNESCTLEDGHEGSCNGAATANPLADPPADAISIVSVSPENGATDVPVDTDIVVTFSDTIRATDSINIILWYSDGNNSESHSGGGSTSREGTVYTMNYANDLLPDTTYSVQVIIIRGENTLNNSENKPTFTTAAAPAVTTVATAEALKTALEASEAATISVTADIAGLGESYSIGADHTLNIAENVTVSTGDYRLTIPQGKTLTLAGTGTLKADKPTSVNTAIAVPGTLKLTAGSNLVADGIIALGASSTPGSLESDGGHITIQNSGTASYGICGASDTGNDRVALAGGSLTVQNTVYYGITDVKLDISDHCAVTVANTSTGMAGLRVDEMSVADSTVRIENTVGQGLGVKTLTVENSAVTVANTASTGILINDYEQDGVFNLKNSTLALENTGGTGLFVNASDKLLIDGSTVTIAANGGTGLERENTTAQVLGANSGKLTLAEGAKLNSVRGVFSDRGSVFNGTTGTVTVGAADAAASTNNLSAGDYTWDGMYFTKGGGSGAANTWDGDGAALAVADGSTITITNTATGALAIPADATVTIIGTVTDAGQVQLDLGTGAKVKWAASYTGSYDNGSLVQSSGSMIGEPGTVEITGSIINNGTTNTSAISVAGNVIVSGGTVIGQEQGIALANTVTINADSRITSTSGQAITANSDIIINGGTIFGGSAFKPALYATNGSITLAGGEITANPGTPAVFTVDAPITVTGDVAISGEVGVTDFRLPTTITINAGGILTVPSGGTLTVNNTGTIVNNGAIVNNGSIVNNGTITNRAGSTYTGANPTGNGAFTPPPGGTVPTVTGVGVNPINTSVNKHDTVQFTAVVVGTGAFDDSVTWSVEGGDSGTYIGTDGLLYVSADETADTLTVKATSTVDTSKSGTATVTVTSAPATTYLLTVTNGTGGGSYAEGATVTITANAPADGQRFKEWSISPEVTFAEGTSKTSQTAKFTMPAQAVSATAAYGSIPAGATAVTGVTLNRSSLSLYSNTTPNTAALTATVSPADATDKTMTWASGNTAVATVDQSGKVTAVGNGTATITVTTTDGGYTASCTVSVSTYSSGGGSGGGGGGGSSSSGGTTTVTPPDPGKPDTATNAETKVTPTVGANGSATVTVPEKSVTDAIKAAQDAAKKAGTEKNGVSVTIDATTTGKGANDITATLTEQSVDALIKAGVTEVRIKSDAATISLDLAALKAAQAVAGGAITVSAKPVAANTLSAAAQNAIGNRPVFSFTLQSSGKPVTSFGGGSAAIAIPYTPQKGEDAGKLCVVYVNDNGGVTYLTDSSYDPNTKALIARTGHFSVYGVGYKADAPVFADTANHWAKADIDFVAARGLLSGTGNNQFSPDTGMTRGMFVTALYRLAGSPQAAGEGSAFTDVPANAYYADAVKWAAEKGIVSGTAATTFAPDTNISREQMAVIMQNYAKALGYTVPKTREAVTFADNGSIGSWAKDAVKAMQMAGIIGGKDGNRFDPTGTATRAEVAAVLHRYVELVIDPATAQGWTQNDAGQWLYYENGKPVTGWKQVDGKWYYLDTAGIMQSGGWKQIGGRWYYLYADGSMAVSTKIDGYEVGPDGGRKES